MGVVTKAPGGFCSRVVTWSAGIVCVSVAVSVASCGYGDVDESGSPRASLTSLEPTGDSESTSLHQGPTVSAGDVGGDRDVVHSAEPVAEPVAEPAAEPAVEPGYEERYPSDPMDNPTSDVTRTLNIPGGTCMDSELGDVREHRGDPVTCANVGDGPQWVQGEPYW